MLGATQTRERACHCLAARSPANLDLEVCGFYLNDSPSLLRLNHLAIVQGTARPKAAAKDLPGLVTTFTLMVTLLGGPTSTSSLYVLASRPGIVSARQDVRFLGHETRSVPLPKSDGFSRFGTVSIRTYSQALLAPFMVELFAAGRLTRTPELVTPAAHVTACGLPTEARLSEPFGHAPPGRDSFVQAPLAQIHPLWPSRPRSTRLILEPA